MITNKRPKISNGVFKTVVREVVKDELQNTEKRLEKKFNRRFEETEAGIEERLDKKLKIRLEETEKNLEEKLDEKIKNLPTKDEFFTAMDKVMGELQTVREEFTVHQGQHYDINDRLEKIENTA